jgi:phenylacetate-CoA ligase
MTVLHAFGMSKGFVGGLPVVQIAQYMGIVDIPIGAEAGAERSPSQSSTVTPSGSAPRSWTNACRRAGMTRGS